MRFFLLIILSKVTLDPRGGGAEGKTLGGRGGGEVTDDDEDDGRQRLLRYSFDIHSPASSISSYRVEVDNLKMTDKMR